MGIALSALRERAREEFPGLDIDLDNGEVIHLLPVTELSDTQLDRFTAAQTNLAESDEAENLKALRAAFVDVLSEVSTDRARTEAVLEAESLGVLITIFRAYSESVSSGSKSESVS